MTRKTKKPQVRFNIRTFLTLAGCVVLVSFAFWYLSLKVPVLPQPPLKDLAAAKNVELGIHVDPNRLDSRIYPDIVTGQFSFITIDGGSHFKEIQPAPNKFDFSATDKMVSFAEKNQMSVQFHHLVWGDPYVLPNWLIKGHYSKTQLLDILHQHINAIMARYKGRVKEYSVVNEAFTENQHTYNLNSWWAAQLGGGTAYVDQLFRWAHTDDPKAKLLLNDFNNETESSVSDEMYNYIKAAKARGVPIDGIGMQLHVDASRPPDKQAITANMQRFAKLGVPVYVTEFDINTNAVHGSDLYKQQLESKISQQIVEACIQSKACVSFDVFGLTSKNDLIKKLTRTNSRAYLFDSRFRPRQAFYAFRKSWQ